MLEIGYKLSSEEHGPNELVRHARMTEESGFTRTDLGPLPSVDGPAGIRKYADAGFDHVCVHQAGPDQEGFNRPISASERITR
jgi:hypothetical protein